MIGSPRRAARFLCAISCTLLPVLAFFGASAPAAAAGPLDITAEQCGSPLTSSTLVTATGATTTSNVLAPSSGHWFVPLFVRVSVSTVAGGGNRAVELRVVDAAGSPAIPYSAPNVLSVPASSIGRFMAVEGLGAGADSTVPLPNFPLSSGSIMSAIVTTGVAGDTIRATVVYCDLAAWPTSAVVSGSVTVNTAGPHVTVDNPVTAVTVNTAGPHVTVDNFPTFPTLVTVNTAAPYAESCGVTTSAPAGTLPCVRQVDGEVTAQTDLFDEGNGAPVLVIGCGVLLAAGFAFGLRTWAGRP